MSSVSIDEGLGLDDNQSLLIASSVKIKVKLEEIFQPAVVPAHYDSKSATNLVGLENLGATCYLNALLQMLFHINSFRLAVYRIPHAAETSPSSMTLALQQVFRDLQTDSREVSTKGLLRAFGWDHADQFYQQDVQEMMRILLEKLEERMRGTDVEGEVKRLFGGQMKSYINCLHVDYSSNRTDDFYDLQLDVAGCEGVLESFRRYTARELLDGDNQYDAEALGKQDAEKGTVFTKLPAVLTVHLKRFQFDPESMDLAKINDRYEFPCNMDLSAFVEGAVEGEWRYSLHSVLVHQGDVTGGHYYCYIRPAPDALVPLSAEEEQRRDAYWPPRDEDCPRDLHLSYPHSVAENWFKFNDEIVLAVSPKEAVRSCFGGDPVMRRTVAASAYMLLYIREQECPQVMAPLWKQHIPRDLYVKLEAERERKMTEERILECEKLYAKITYFLDEDVAVYSSYSKSSDFVQPRRLRWVRAVLRTSSYISLPLALADQLGISPLRLRIWSTRRNKGLLRVLRLLSPETPQLRWSSDEVYYVEMLCGQPPSEEADQQYRSLRQAEEVWRGDAKQLLQDCGALRHAEQSDFVPSAGCGIASSNRPLTLYAPDSVRRQELMQRMTALQRQMIDLIDLHSAEIAEDAVLLFVKVFDPRGELHLRPSSAADSDADLPHDPNDTFVGPLKHLTSHLFDKDQLQPAALFSAVCSDLLASVGGLLPDRWRLASSDDGSEVVPQLSLSLLASGLQLIWPPDESDPSPPLRHGDLLVLHFAVPSELIRTAAHCASMPPPSLSAWIHFMTHQRRVLLQPFSELDRAIVVAIAARESMEEDLEGVGKRQRDEMSAQSSPAQPEAPLDLVLNSQCSTADVCEMLAERTFVNPKHLLLMASTNSLMATGASSCYAVSICNNDISVQQLLAESRTKPATIFYRVSPFARYSYIDKRGTVCEEPRPGSRFLEVMVVDRRLRELRRPRLAAPPLDYSHPDSETTAKRKKIEPTEFEDESDSSAEDCELDSEDGSLEQPREYCSVAAHFLTDDKIYLTMKRTDTVDDVLARLEEEVCQDRSSLALVQIRRGVAELLSPADPIERLPASWTDARSQLKTAGGGIGLQLLTTEERRLCSVESAQSAPISVFLFSGQIAHGSASPSPRGPFVSHLLPGDSLASLQQRLARVAAVDWSVCRAALIIERLPTYLPDGPIWDFVHQKAGLASMCRTRLVIGIDTQLPQPTAAPAADRYSRAPRVLKIL